MPRAIFKYELPSELTTSIMLPVGAKVLCCGAQGEQLFVWAEVEPEIETHVARNFCVVGTGHPIDFDTSRFVGTAMMRDGALVWHVFEV